MYRGFFAECPKNWDDILGLIAASFSFSETEIWDMPMDRALFWASQARRLNERSAG